MECSWRPECNIVANRVALFQEALDACEIASSRLYQALMPDTPPPESPGDPQKPPATEDPNIARATYVVESAMQIDARAAAASNKLHKLLAIFLRGTACETCPLALLGLQQSDA